MNTTDEITALIIRYLNERYPGKYEGMSAEMLQRQPYHKLIWTWWKALAYYGIKGNYERLEDVVEGTRYVSIMGENKVKYELMNGKYVAYQEITKKECEGVYGDRIPGR